MKRLELSDAVHARVAICHLALTHGASDALVGQALAELGDEVLHALAMAQSVRLAKLPTKATAVSVVVDVELRRKRRSRA